MRTASLLVVCMVVGAATLGTATTRTIDFSGDTVGEPPTGFEFGLTANAGAPVK